MKRRFATKLILSGAALAVSAATLVSTTYAWYVQNSLVTATGVSGTVQDKDASSIFISKDYIVATKAATWGPSVTYAAEDYVKAIDPTTKKYDASAAAAEGKMFEGGLDPVTRTSGAAFVYPNNVGTKNVISTTDTQITVNASDRVIQFDLYVQTNAANTKVRPYIVIQNTTTSATLSAQTAYREIKSSYYYANNTKTAGNVTKDSAFWTDAVQAMRLEVDVVKALASAWDTEANTTKEYYDLLSVAKGGYTVADGFSEYSPVKTITGASETLRFLLEEDLANDTVDYITKSDVAAAGAERTLKGAHAYYAGMVGAEPKAGFANQLTYTVPTTAGKINTTTLASANTAYKFTFKFWLDGTDASCFDCCAGQTFNISTYFLVEA